MAHEDVEVVLEAFRRFQAGDMAAVAELYTGDAVITAPDGWPEAGPFEGRAAVKDQLARLAADWDEQRFEEMETVAAAKGWVVLRYTWRTRGVSSGIESSFRMAAACRVRGARIAEAHFRREEQAALDAAGLAETQGPSGSRAPRGRRQPVDRERDGG